MVAFTAPEGPDEAVEAAVVEADADTLETRSNPWYPCSAGDGELLAYLRVSDFSPDICERMVTNEPDTEGHVSCYDLRDSLGCRKIIPY
ncbi:hypothetical protein [Nannocystis pusilla]|uniref:Uncharacterized protein n=1 Tax=Nannocystis pusilla TaxID=889268 RepID=A0ABS7TXN8_9BACT|nr:hypothetical protein [Nannocystis pusilla]MBZ5712959.1 hypothetical protein [Nannocystis pusilla]